MKTVILLLMFVAIISNSFAGVDEVHVYGSFKLMEGASLENSDVNIEAEPGKLGFGGGVELGFKVQESEIGDYYLVTGLSIEKGKELDSCSISFQGVDLGCTPSGAQLGATSLYVNGALRLKNNVGFLLGLAWIAPTVDKSVDVGYSIDPSLGFNLGMSYDYKDLRTQIVYKKVSGTSQVFTGPLKFDTDYKYNSLMLTIGFVFK